MMLFFLIDVVCWIILGPYPENAEGWFALLQNNRLAGLLLLSFPTLFGMMLYYLTFLGLYNILKQVNKAYASLAALFAFAGLAILLVKNTSYSMVYLSIQHAAAATEHQKALLLTAGEINITTLNTGMNLGGFLVEGAAVLFSILMLRSDLFGKKTAYLGILGHGLDFIRIIMIMIFLPEAFASILLMIGGLPQLIWLILVGRQFLNLGKRQPIV